MRRIAISLALLGVLLVPATSSAAGPDLLFVVDTSGSMSGTRIVQAKEALHTSISALDEDQMAGLRSYAGACGDGGLLRVPIGTANRDELRSATDALFASGGTPTPDALRAGAADFAAGNPGTIILISDGQSGCGDPCPVAAELSSRLGVAFRVHAVGFQAADAAEQELACIAGATGGSYYSADDAQGLADAISNALNTTFKYVALGDSFSSGEGIEPFFEPTNECHRSKLAYPNFVERPGLAGISIKGLKDAGISGIEWGFQACSGAQTEHVMSEGRYDDPLPQLAPDRTFDTGNANDLPVDAETNLATITIGGNNVQFTHVLRFCATSNDCTSEKFRGQSLAQFARSQRDTLAPKLSSLYARINNQAPRAKILVLGYPHLFPATAGEQNCGKLAQRDWVTTLRGRAVRVSVGFSQREQNYLRQLTSELNQTIAHRAESSNRAEFVPVDGWFAGHEICGDGGEWINAVTITRGLEPNDQSFYPNALGQRLGYAGAVNHVLHGGGGLAPLGG